jgi:hypothetical protein
MSAEKSKIIFLGSKVRLVCTTDNLTAFVSLLSRQYGILNISQPYRPPRPVTGVTLLHSICIYGRKDKSKSSWSTSKFLFTVPLNIIYQSDTSQLSLIWSYVKKNCTFDTQIMENIFDNF